MAKTTIVATQLAFDVASADLPVTAGEAINPANTIVVNYPQDGKLFLVINNTFAGAKVVTIKGSDEKEFVAAGLGDLAVSFAQDDVKYLVVSSDRFKNSDGQLELSFAASMTGFVQAFLMP